MTFSDTGRLAILAVTCVSLGLGCGEDEPTPETCTTAACGNGSGQWPTTGGTTGSTQTSGSPTTATGSVPVAGSLPCDVAEVVQAKCQQCHSDPPVGTFMPLLTQSHFQASSTTDPSRPYYAVANDRIHSAENPMPPRTSPQLTAEEKATLANWFAQGAPAGTVACEGGQTSGGGFDGGATTGDAGPELVGSVDGGGPQVIGEEIDVSELDCYRFTAHAVGDKAEKFPVGTAVDAYYAFAFAAPWSGTGYGAVVRPLVDNAQVLHHWLLYKEPAGGLDGTVQPTGGWHASGELMAGYAPGGTAMDFRTRGDVGFELQETNYTLEVHYNSGDPNAVDASGVEVCLFKEKPTNVATQSWVGFDNGTDGYILAGVSATPVLSGNCGNPKDVWVGTCDPGHNQDIQMLYLMPHMHEAGVHMKAVIVDAFGNELRTLHDEPFDFDYQVTYETNEVLRPGERIVTTCTFSEPKCVGQATGAEMCYLYTYAWPGGALSDNTTWGPLAHGENTCLGQNFP